jgi:acetyl-CoA carboxylase biotin carboxyl carrier protein
MKLTNEDVQEILQLLDATKYDELHLETERFKLSLRRNRKTGDWSREEQILSAPNIVKCSPDATALKDNALHPTAAKARVPRNVAWIDVSAHLPGTFYRAPKPGAAPFVEVGSAVEENTVVGIIETMKLMNAVHAETRGEVAEICCGNAQFVEKDTVLMCIKPGGA